MIALGGRKRPVSFSYSFNRMTGQVQPQGFLSRPQPLPLNDPLAGTLRYCSYNIPARLMAEQLAKQVRVWPAVGALGVCSAAAIASSIAAISAHGCGRHSSGKPAARYQRNGPRVIQCAGANQRFHSPGFC